MPSDLDDFLSRLRKAAPAFRWEVCENASLLRNGIRGLDGKGDVYCPITAVLFFEQGESYLPCHAETIGVSVLGLTPGTVRGTIEAADYTDQYPDLRRRLLEAVGLAEGG